VPKKLIKHYVVKVVQLNQIARILMWARPSFQNHQAGKSSLIHCKVTAMGEQVKVMKVRMRVPELMQRKSIPVMN
jgi:hypothetical protein